MKIARYKKASKTLSFYRNNFGFRDPYQVLIDATFCQLALQHQINIDEQLPKYLQSELRLVTTACCIMEAEGLGGAVAGATQIVKKFLVHKCGHDKKLLTGAACMKSMVAQNNYIIASQDRELQDWMRERPGQPLMYLHQRTPVLEQPSEASRKHSERQQDETHDFGEREAKRLAFLKRAAGLKVEADEVRVAKKKFKKKQPNPLSCKKKKKKPAVAQGGVQKAKARVTAVGGVKAVATGELGQGSAKKAKKTKAKAAKDE